MPLIALVRHGQASFGAAEYDELSAVGRRQAEILGAELVRRRLRDPDVVCGSLRRQRDTADVLMAAAGLAGQARIDVRWNEYDHLGLVRRYVEPGRVKAAAGDSRTFQGLLDEALTAWSGDTADAGWAEFSGAAAAALTELAAGLPAGRDAVVVTSGGVLAVLVAGMLGAPAASAVALNRVAVNAAITTVVVGRSGTNMVSFNEHAHLVGADRSLLTNR